MGWLLMTAGILSSLAGCSGSDLLNRLMTATPTDTRTASATPTATASATASATRTSTSTPSQTASPTDTLTLTQTSTAEPPTDTITPGPSPTSTQTATRTPTITSTPTDTLTPTATEIPTETLIPTPHLAFLRLSQPGWMSKVVSPLHISSIISPGEDGYIHIILRGEDGRVISQLDQHFYTRLGTRFLFDQKIDFSIPGPAEYARLEIRTQDRWGRNISMSTVDLLLLGMGRAEVYDPVSELEPYIIYYPFEGKTITGGSVLVQGQIQPVNNSPVIFELVDGGGNIVGTTRINAPKVEDGQTHAQFNAAVPYKVDAATDVRLIIRQESAGRIPGTVALTSERLVLAP